MRLTGHGGWPRRMMIPGLPVLGVLLDGPEREMDGLQILVAAALASRVARPGPARLDGGFGGLASPCPRSCGVSVGSQKPLPRSNRSDMGTGCRSFRRLMTPSEQLSVTGASCPPEVIPRGSPIRHWSSTGGGLVGGRPDSPVMSLLNGCGVSPLSATPRRLCLLMPVVDAAVVAQRFCVAVVSAGLYWVRCARLWYRGGGVCGWYGCG